MAPLPSFLHWRLWTKGCGDFLDGSQFSLSPVFKPDTEPYLAGAKWSSVGSFSDERFGGHVGG